MTVENCMGKINWATLDPHITEHSQEQQQGSTANADTFKTLGHNHKVAIYHKICNKITSGKLKQQQDSHTQVPKGKESMTVEICMENIN